MAKLTIPPQYHAGLKLLMELDEETADKLYSALSDAPPAIDEQGLAQAITSKVEGVSVDDLEIITEMLISLQATANYYGISADIFTLDICEAITEDAIEGLKVESADSCTNRLRRFFDVESLSVPQKVISVLRDHEYMFCKARIITDIRPVFGSDIEQGPTAAVIVHMLKISYHEGDDIKDFYLAMDTGDIQSLRDILDRADAKAKILKPVLENAKVPYLDVQ